MSAWFSHVDGRWEEPRFAAMLNRIATMGRLIVFDKRGSGASDPLAAAEPTWEDWADDISAVLEATDSERATVIGVGDSGPLAMLFAASHPHRVTSLVLINTGARLVQGPDYPWGLTGAEVEHFLRRTRETWGTGGIADAFSPATASDERYRQRAARLGDQRWRAVLATHDDIVRAQLKQFRGRLHRATGDGVLATFDGPARGIRCAQSLRDALRGAGIDIRSGLHAGEIELRGDEIGGIAVHIAARIGAQAESGEILCSSTVKELVTGSDLAFVDRGRHELKGVQQEWQIYAVQ